MGNKEKDQTDGRTLLNIGAQMRVRPACKAKLTCFSNPFIKLADEKSDPDEVEGAYEKFTDTFEELIAQSLSLY